MEYIHGGDIYTYQGLMDFSININPFGPQERVVYAVKQAAEHIGVYPDSQCRKLKRALSEKLQVPPEFLIFGNGAADIIFSLVLAKKPEKALLMAPSFAEYEQALQSVDCEIVYHALKEENDFCLTEDILSSLVEGLDMVFLCSPDNPSGAVISKELLRKILRSCEEHHILMVLDECFWEFAYDGLDKTMQQEALCSENCFLLRAFTKMHAMPGVRLGYGVCTNKALLEKMCRIRQPWGVSSLAQAAGLAAMEDDEWPRVTREFVCTEREWMRGKLAELGIHCYPSSANYILMKSDKNLYEMLKKRGYLIRDCANYRGLGRGYYRIAVKTRAENRKLLAAVSDIYEEGDIDG